MNIETNKSIVVIDIPRFCVPADTAEVFIQAANRFMADIKEEMIEKYKSQKLKFDNRYHRRELIPFVAETNSYSDILDMKVDVTQYDKYVSAKTDNYVNNEQVYEIWHQELEEKEETEHEE